MSRRKSGREREEEEVQVQRQRGRRHLGTYLCWDARARARVCVFVHVCVLSGKEECTSASLST